MYKQEIRLLVKEKIEGLSPEQKAEESRGVSARIIQFLQEKNPQTVITYFPFPDEVDITPVTAWAESEKKNLIVIGQDTSLPTLTLDGNTCMLVPGRAFTTAGQRIGRGAGFYDRLLAQFPDMHKIGVCFLCQVFDELPEDTWDQKMDTVVFGGNELE